MPSLWWIQVHTKDCFRYNKIVPYLSRDNAAKSKELVVEHTHGFTLAGVA